MKITIDDVQKEPTKSIYELIADAKTEATLRGIKANSIVINRGLVFVPGDPFLYPEMICGLKSYITAKELPEDYAFAVLHDPNRDPETEMKWISVKERLPEKNTDVLIYNIEEYVGTDFLTKDGKWFWNEELPPTHWMPLPEPPKGE